MHVAYAVVGLLIMKILSLLQDEAPTLASAIVSSREATGRVVVETLQ